MMQNDYDYNHEKINRKYNINNTTNLFIFYLKFLNDF